MVEPDHHGKRRVVHVLKAVPRSLAEDPLGLVEPDDRFGECVVVRVPDAPDRRLALSSGIAVLNLRPRSACLTQLRSVSAAHPIFSAIERMAAGETKLPGNSERIEEACPENKGRLKDEKTGVSSRRKRRPTSSG